MKVRTNHTHRTCIAEVERAQSDNYVLRIERDALQATVRQLTRELDAIRNAQPTRWARCLRACRSLLSLRPLTTGGRP